MLILRDSGLLLVAREGPRVPQPEHPAVVPSPSFLDHVSDHVEVAHLRAVRVQTALLLLVFLPRHRHVGRSLLGLELFGLRRQLLGRLRQRLRGLALRARDGLVDRGPLFLFRRFRHHRECNWRAICSYATGSRPGAEERAERLGVFTTCKKVKSIGLELVT